MLVLIALNRHKYWDIGKNISIKENNKKYIFRRYQLWYLQQVMVLDLETRTSFLS